MIVFTAVTVPFKNLRQESERLTYDKNGTEENLICSNFSYLERVERSMRRIVEWQDALQEAVHERDPREIEGRVLRAEIAIFERIHSPSRIDSLETQALFDALKAIRLLRSSAHRIRQHSAVSRP